MREIKFRAWDTFNKLMWGQDKCYEKDLATFFREYQDAINGENEPILMQFTGLKDKQGKEIYEGDIVKFRWSRQYRQKVVAWGHCGFWLEGWGERELYHIDSRELEVIGNIYENPELLEPKS